MILKNLLRRKVRTLLTVLGIAIGVAAIIGLGTLADGLKSGYGSMLTGSKADLTVSQPNAYDLSYSAIDEAIGNDLAAMPEVSEISAMMEGFVATENEPFFFVFGHPEGSFVLERFQVIEGHGLFDREVQKMRGEPILLGSAAAEVMGKSVGDSMRITGSVYRIIGIYQTGDAFEDSGALLSLDEAQELLGRPRQVNLFYIRLKDRSLQDRLVTRLERQFPDLEVSGAAELNEKQSLTNALQAYVWAIGMLAILIGGVGMMNSQFMSVFERTREIGVLRAVGWSRFRVLWMILGESLAVSLLGGAVGVGLGLLALEGLTKITVIGGLKVGNLSSGLLLQAFIVVLLLGFFGGVYPAMRAAQLPPVEALRYEGGSTSKHIRRLPLLGMTAQSLWQRSARTLLTMAVIGITVGSLMALEGVIGGLLGTMGESWFSGSEIMIRQANVSDTSLSAMDERIGDKIAAMPEVKAVSSTVFTAVVLPDAGAFFIVEGYAPADYAIRRFKIIEGGPLTSNHQIILGRPMAQSLKKKSSDTIELGGVRFRIVGVYESSTSWEELGGVITLRDAQAFVGRPRKVMMYGLKLHDATQAQPVVEKINAEFPEVHAAVQGEFLSQMPDMQNMDGMMSGISLLAIVVGGVGVLNTMLMAVFERTREIGVLRALGWRRRAVLGMIMKEALLLGLLGGVTGILVALGLVYSLRVIPMMGSFLTPTWEWPTFARALGIATALGLLGGLYPALRATRLQPVEALRYE